MLGSFEELEKDIEKFHNNVMASSELVESLTATTQAIKAQTATVERVSYEVTEKVASISAEIAKKISDSLDFGALQKSFETLKANVSMKLNIVIIISVLALIAAVAGIFIK